MRNSPGFTLIELLIVVVIIGILAAIALPKFGTAREAAFYSTLKADLANLQTAQEIYYQTSGAHVYTATMSDLDFRVSSGVTLGGINLLNGAQAWEVAATHNGLAGGACVIGFGQLGGESWTVSAGDPAVAVTNANAGNPDCND